MKRFRRSTALCCVAAASIACRAAEKGDETTPPPPSAPMVQTREVDYQQGSTQLKGFIAWDSAASGKRPGVLVVHEWWGHNDHARAQARKLAEAGYVGFAVDMYGGGKSTTHPDSAQAFMMAALSDPAALVARFNAALDLLKQDPNVDPERIAAIGYCFGGAVVLSQARMGADLDAVISLHGALQGLPPVDSGKVKARVLVLTGGADPMVPAAQVEKFKSEMEAAGARVEVITYPNAKHAFTNPAADKTGVPGLAYDADADRQSWAELVRVLSDVFR